MTTFDALARSSAGAIHHSVSYVPVHPTSITGAAGSLTSWTFGRYALAGAVAGIALIGALFIAGTDEADVTGESTPSTTVTTPTVPDGEPTVPTTMAGPLDPLPAPVVPPVAPPSPDTTTTSLAPDVEPPLLKIDNPADGDRFETAVLRFSGRTEVGASVLASGKFAASVASDGSWYIDLILAPGANGVVFVASDAAGKTTTVKVTVYLDEPVTEQTTSTTTTTVPKTSTTTTTVPKTSTTTTTVPKWEFTANQKYGSCALPIPYDIFSGTTKPGTAVTISSPYGGGTTTANADGTWSITVEFPTAPYNEWFVVSATDYKGTAKTFEFVNLYQG